LPFRTREPQPQWLLLYAGPPGTGLSGKHHGPGLSLSESGFGAYDHFTKEVSYEDDRVKAKLKTGKPEQQNSIAYGFDLSFDLPISTYEKK